MSKKILYLLIFLSFLSAERFNLEADSLYMLSPKAAALGGCGTVLYNSAEGLFYNPAVIYVSKPKFFLATYSGMDDITNLNAALIVPFNSIALGVGYRSTRVSGIDVVPMEAFNSISGRPEASMIQEASYKKESLSLGLASKFDFWEREIFWGIGFKTFANGATGADKLDDVNAYGYEADLGFYTKLTKYWSVGLAGRNILVDNGAGRGGLSWKNGSSEMIPAVFSLGNRFALNDDGIIIYIDADYYEKQYLPNLLKYGFEVRPLKYFAFSASYSQYPMAEVDGYKVRNTVAAGFSLMPWSDLRMDYAFVPGDGTAYKNTHYVSVGLDSFAIFTPPDISKIVDKPSVGELNLADNLVTESATVTLRVQTRGLRAITINGFTVPIEHNYLERNMLLAQGKNILDLEYAGQKLRRKIWRKQSYEELIEDEQDHDVAKLVTTRMFNTTDWTKQYDLITNAELAEYVYMSLGLKVPEDLNKVFNKTDYLLLNGYIQADHDYVTKIDVALMLAKLEGYGYAIDGESSEARGLVAVDILESTGYYTKQDFYPAEVNISRRELVNLLAKTRAVTSRLVGDNPDMPIYWLEFPVTAEQLDHNSIYIHLLNASRFRSVESLINRYKRVYLIEKDQSVRIDVPMGEYNDSKGLDIKLSIKDRTDNIYISKIIYAYSKANKKLAIQQRLVDQPKVLTRGAVLKQLNIEPPFSQKYNLLVKTTPEQLKKNEKFTVYAGIMPKLDEAISVKFVFSDNQAVKAIKVNPYLWKFEKRFKKPGNYYVKVFVKNDKGELLTKKMELTVK